MSLNVWTRRMARWWTTRSQRQPGSRAARASARRPGTTWYSFERLEDRTLPAVLTVNAAADNVTNDAVLTLREAIAVINDGNHLDGVAELGGRMLSAGELLQLNLTNPLGVGDEVRFDAAAVNAANPLLLDGAALGDMDITRDVVITGNGSLQTIIDAQFNSRVFEISGADVDVTIDALSVVRGRTTIDGDLLSSVGGHGGAIKSVADASSLLTIRNSAFVGNTTAGLGAAGGAVFAEEAGVTVISSTFLDNATENTNARGGAISSRGGSVTIEGSRFESNAARAQGGAVDTDQGHVTVTDSLFTGNSTVDDFAGGGAISAFSGDIRITASTLSGNSTDGDEAKGGAVSAYNGDIVVEDSELSGNSTGDRFSFGGAAYAANGTITVTGSDVIGNFTTGYLSGGGALSAGLGKITIIGSAVTGNFTSGNNAAGGAVQSGQGVIDITDSDLSSNATRGQGSPGGAVRAVAGDIHIALTTVSNNSTTGLNSGGGAIDNQFGYVTVVNSTVSGNQALHATSSGGGVHADDGAVTVINSTFSGNRTSAAGGAIYAAYGAVTVVNSTLTGNSGGVRGGAVAVETSSRFEPIVVHNSIVAGNLATTFPDLDDAPGLAGTVRHSLIGDNTGVAAALPETGTLTPDANGNWIGGSVGGAIDPLLGPLAFHGGPTRTHALLPGSLAIDAGDDALAIDLLGNPLTSDQRSAPFHRSFGAAVEMGAFEVQALQSIADGRATFIGTDGNDRFFADVAAGVVTVNSVRYVLPADVMDLLLDGLLGTDSLSLLGTPGDEVVRLLPGQGFLDSSSVGVTGAALSMEVIVFHGQGGTDEVTFLDSFRNDRFVGRRPLSRMVGQGFDNFARDVDTVFAQAAAGGSDSAFLFDTPGDNVFTASSTTAAISGSGRTANGFEVVVGYASAGNDTAVLTGTAARDLLLARPLLSSLHGGGMSLYASRFDQVIAAAGGGHDVARLYGGATSADTLTAGPGLAAMTGRGFQYTAIGFETVVGLAIGAGDAAFLQDSPGNDLFIGHRQTGTLLMPGGSIAAAGFSRITILGTSGGTNRRAVIPPLAFQLSEQGRWS